MSLLLATSLLVASLGAHDHDHAHEHGSSPVTDECSDCCHQASTPASKAPTVVVVGEASDDAASAERKRRTNGGYDSAESIRGPPEHKLT